MNTCSVNDEFVHGDHDVVLAEMQYVYLDFDGELTSYHNEELGLDIENVSVSNSGLTQERIDDITVQLNSMFAGQNLYFVSTRPSDTQKYSTVFVGKTDAFGQYGDFGGLAETVDVGNQNPSDNAFVMLDATADNAEIIETVAHETEHLVGTLEHEGDGLERYAFKQYKFFTNEKKEITPISVPIVGGATAILTTVAHDYNPNTHRYMYDKIYSVNVPEGTEGRLVLPVEAFIPTDTSILKFAEGKTQTNYTVNYEYISNRYKEEDYLGNAKYHTGYPCYFIAEYTDKVYDQGKKKDGTDNTACTVAALINVLGMLGNTDGNAKTYDTIVEKLGKELVGEKGKGYNFSVLLTDGGMTQGTDFECVECPTLSQIEEALHSGYAVALAYNPNGAGKIGHIVTIDHIANGTVYYTDSDDTLTGAASSGTLESFYKNNEKPIAYIIKKNTWSLEEFSKTKIETGTSQTATLSKTHVTKKGNVTVSQNGSVSGNSYLDGGSLAIEKSVTAASDASIHVSLDRDNFQQASIQNLSNLSGGNVSVDVGQVNQSGKYKIATNAREYNGKYSIEKLDLAGGISASETGDTKNSSSYSSLFSVPEIEIGTTVRNGSISYVLNLDEDDSLILSVSYVLENLLYTPEKTSWDGNPYTNYVVEYSADDFAHVVRFETDDSSLDTLSFLPGTYSWRIKVAGDPQWFSGGTFSVASVSNDAVIYQSGANDTPDVFWASGDGTWGAKYSAQHVGSGDWSGTGERVKLSGKNKICDIFEGSTDANVLVLTDDANGDALFVDDVYSELPAALPGQQSRLAQIDEIRAGAGDDIVDMTSQRFEYIGEGVTIRGGFGNDVIWANKGENKLFGDDGNDRIVGAAGADVIVGGSGNDSMHGGGGNDVFCFCENWGTDTIEQLSGGNVTLWFASGTEECWDQSTMTYTAGTNSVKVTGVSEVTLKFGDDGSEQYDQLLAAGAFMEASSEKIFEESGKGVLAVL